MQIINSNPPIGYDFDTLIPRIGSACGYAVAKDVAAIVHKAETEDQKRIAVINDLGKHGVSRMHQLQEQKIIDAAESGSALPMAVPAQPDMVLAIQEQQQALKADRAKKNAPLWPLVIQVWAEFNRTAQPWADNLEDGERELADRMGLPFQPSATLATIRHALARAAVKSTPPKDSTKLNASPISLFCGLIA